MKPEEIGEPESRSGVVYPDEFPTTAEHPPSSGSTEDAGAIAGRWEYRVAVVDDLVDGVDTMMKAWADAGWELVSGSTSSWASSSPMSQLTTWHTRYSCFWRRPATR